MTKNEAKYIALVFGVPLLLGVALFLSDRFVNALLEWAGR
jgi:hypothetical protein